MADKLTAQQALAVHNRGGRLLVSAAAGSGKTKVLVDRLLSYLTDANDPANLDDFLIITYTKAAASELRGKIAAKLTERIAEEPENRHLQKQMQRLFLTKISTVHGFCSDLLREYAYRLDLPADFRVADENECREIRTTVIAEMLDRAYESAEQNGDFLAFVDSQGLGRDDRLVPEIIEKVYDSACCHLDPEDWLEKCLISVGIDDISDTAETVWGKYLMEDLSDYLEKQIQVLRKCAERLEACDGMEKSAINIRNTLNQLVELKSAKTWDEIVQNKHIDYGRLIFPKKNRNPELSEQVKAARNACKKGLERKLNSFSDVSEQILQDLAQSSSASRGLVALVREFKKDYLSAKRSRRVLDFSDLEQKVLDLLLGKSRTAPTATANEIGQRYREILVDEYQDSNGVQDAIFSALTWEKQNCFLVGDVKQSIYQFRLADPGIFLEKYRAYVPAEEARYQQGRKVLLSHNFRSGAEVIEGVNSVFETCMRPEVGGLYYGEAESLREGIPHVSLGQPGVELFALEVRESTYAEEAAFVAEKIQKMLQEKTPVRSGETLRPVKPDDIVILLRSPGSAGHYFQKALEDRGIRCASGGGADLLQTEEVATLRAFLQIILNPRQDIPLITTLASPIFGFTADDLAVIRSKQKQGAIYDALLLNHMPKTEAFLHVLKRLRNEARMNTLTGLLECCFTETRLDSIYASLPGGGVRSSNLRAFYQIAADFEKGNLRNLSQFLEHLDAMSARGLITSGTAAGDCVNIMSIHKSKGLEFPVVFLCNLSRKFNQESLRGQILCDKELGLGLSVADNINRVRYPTVSKRAIAVKMAAEGVSEEMRVLYVAMTRARDRLIMTYASQTLQNDLQDIALRLDFDNGALLCKDAICLGDWILLSAMRRMEAGELHALGGRPTELRISEYPWSICVTEAPVQDNAVVGAVVQDVAMPSGLLQELEDALSYRYGYITATQTPSKQTATDRKGRFKDSEAAENAQQTQPMVRSWRQPAFVSQQQRGKEYGNAIHAAMQYIRYDRCQSVDSVREEINRLVEQRFLSNEQGMLVNCEKIARFFSTDIGQKLMGGISNLREFKFSILDAADNYGADLDGEQVLLQGVVDCALLEEDGITIVDFKTDYVTEENLTFVTQRYRPQVETYAEALCRIFEKAIKKKYLYYFRLDRFVEV